MIQWCEDCKYAYGEPEADTDWCNVCLNDSKPGEIPWGYITKNLEISEGEQ